MEILARNFFIIYKFQYINILLGTHSYAHGILIRLKAHTNLLRVTVHMIGKKGMMCLQTSLNKYIGFLDIGTKNSVFRESLLHRNMYISK